LTENVCSSINHSQVLVIGFVCRPKAPYYQVYAM